MKPCPDGATAFVLSGGGSLGAVQVGRAEIATQEWLANDSHDPDPRWALLPHRHHIN